MIKPTIGRIVLVIGRWGNNADPMQPEPGRICYVHNDRLINVGGDSYRGQPFAEERLTLVQEGDPVPEGVHAVITE